MPIDASIYGALGTRPRSMLEYSDDLAKQDFDRQKLQQNALALMQGQNTMRDQDAVRRAILGLPADHSEADRITALEATGTPLGFTQADALRKSSGGLLKDRATANKDMAETALKSAELLGRLSQSVEAMPTKENAAAAVAQWEQHIGQPDANERQLVAQLNTPEDVKAWARAHFMRAQDLAAQYQTRNTGGTTDTIAIDPLRGKVSVANSVPNTVSPEAELSAQTQRRGQDLTNARALDANNANKEAQRTQIVVDPNMGVLAVDKGTGQYKPIVSAQGLPVPGENTVKAGKQAMQIGEGIDLARQLLGEGPTQSGVGSLADKTANLVGVTLGGAEKAAQLKTLSGWLVANVPRMEGPQSNFDVQNYREMAAKVGDETVPIKQRKAALQTLEQLQQKYREINGSVQPQGSWDGSERRSGTLRFDAQGNPVK